MFNFLRFERVEFERIVAENELAIFEAYDARRTRLREYHN